VPSQTINFGEDVDEWWTRHWANPASSNYIGDTIRAPEPVIDVMADYGGNLQAALDALPESGGTLYLRNGHYGRADVVERSNVHLRGESKSGVRLQGLRFASCPELIDYANANVQLNNRDPRILSCLTNRHRNLSVSNLTFDGTGISITWHNDHHYTLNGALLVRSVRDFVLEDVDMVGYSGDQPPIVANVLVDGVWGRRLNLSGDGLYQFFTDGCHGCGLLDSHLGMARGGGVMYYVNDDWTDDRFPEDGVYSDAEKRLSNYTVIKGNTIDHNNAFAIGHQGAHALIEGNTSTGFHADFVKLETRPNVNHTGEYSYRHVGHRVRNNTVQQAFYIVRWSAGGQGCQISNDTECPWFGDFVVENNRVLDARRYNDRGEDEDQDGVAFTGELPTPLPPVIISGNTIGEVGP
jgi:hypothetical protein